VLVAIWQNAGITFVKPHLPLAIVLVGVISFPCVGCSNEKVQARQQAISGAQSDVLNNRSTRIQARDERMWAAREVWFE
jgi:hypothetical protein